LKTNDKKRCHTCISIRKEDVTSTSDIRNISKSVALGIWEEGYPKHRWAFYDKPVCGKCRKYFESKYLTKEMRCKADTIFGKTNN